MDARELFVRYFLPLYPPDAASAADLARARATDANPGHNRAFGAHLEDAADRFVDNARRLFGSDLGLDRSDASVHRLGAALGPDRGAAWAAQGAAGSADSVLFNATVHAAAYVGSCVVAAHGGVWSVRRPLWESQVTLRSRAGHAHLAVFHWVLKAVADPPEGASLADRYRAHVEVPCAEPEGWPVWCARSEALPRLVRPRYHTLHRYLRAHLPELRDVGEHFPSPERLDSLSLRWLEARPIGGGRRVLLAGASGEGLHLFWMASTGFEKSVFFPCDPAPEPSVAERGETLVVSLQEKGRARTEEMLWWGP